MNVNNLTALSILVGFALVAGAIFFSGNNPLAANSETLMADSSVSRSAKIKFVYGDPKAATTIVEFSDYECPFCARVHPTIKQLVDESEGRIKWEYRHLPLATHVKAKPTAMIAECVGRELGNEAFWQFSDIMFSNQDKLSVAYASEEAISLGLSNESLTTCMEDVKIENQIKIDELTAKALGGSGTPFSIIVYPDGTMKPVKGALPYDNWLPLLEQS